MQKRVVDKLEFYITNVCNLDCSNCNRFNNHKFGGHQTWKDYEHDYREWARKLDVLNPVIMGGEPLLNPSILDWINGLNLCFGRDIQVLSNGTRLNKTPGLYAAMIGQGFHNWIGISLHNINDLDRCFAEIHRFLQSPVAVLHGKDARNGYDMPIAYGADYTFIDINDVTVRVWIQDSFYTSAIHRAAPRLVNGEWQEGQWTVFDNDPVAAHQNCEFAKWKNYHMIKGRLHKCGPCVLMAEFDKQIPLDITQEDRKILQNYQGLSAWDDEQTADVFFQQLDQVIPQCKFCPTQEQTRSERIFAQLKRTGSTGTFG